MMSAYEYFRITQFVVNAVLERGWNELQQNLKGELEFFVEYLIEHEVPMDNEYIIRAWFSYRTEVSVTPRFPSAKLRALVIAKHGYKCTKCDSQDKINIDHVLPYSKFGRTVFENLTVLCEKCNKSKNNRGF